MDNKDEAKNNILQGVNKKIKKRGIRIAIISCVVCLIVAIIVFIVLLVFQIPINSGFFNDTEIKYEEGSGKNLEASDFDNVRVDMRVETINQVSDEELSYNHLHIPIKESLMFSLKTNGHFYSQNHDDGTATLYFYMSENLIQKTYSPDGKYYVDILVTPILCNTDTNINEITKVYYLVYDYEKFNQQEFDKAKSNAVLLWQKQ